MGIPSFTQGYPPDGSTLGNTKSTIRNNLDGEFLVFSKDHQNQNESNPGYHDVIHQTLQGSAPSPITGINQVFSLVPPSNVPSGGDTQLFNLTGNGALSQLTGILKAQNGYFWAGGALVQYGVMAIPSGSSSTGPVTFPIGFPNVCYSVYFSLVSKVGGTASSSNTIAIRQQSLTQSGFTYDYNGNSGSYTFFYFLAIGN